MFSTKEFVIPDIYSSTAADGYSFVTSTHAPGDGYQLLGLTCINATSSTLFVQVYDGYSVAAHIVGHTPIVVIQVAANSQGSLDLGSVNCIPVSKGILVAASSTPLTFTAVASAMYNTVFYIQ